jgi:hypothetical protein
MAGDLWAGKDSMGNERMTIIDTVWKARAVKAAILARVHHAMDVSERWYGQYLLCRGSKWPRARRYALRCRAMAVVRHDRSL